MLSKSNIGTNRIILINSFSYYICSDSNGQLKSQPDWENSGILLLFRLVLKHTMNKRFSEPEPFVDER